MRGRICFGRRGSCRQSILFRPTECGAKSRRRWHASFRKLTCCSSLRSATRCWSSRISLVIHLSPCARDSSRCKWHAATGRQTQHILCRRFLRRVACHTESRSSDDCSTKGHSARSASRWNEPLAWPAGGPLDSSVGALSSTVIDHENKVEMDTPQQATVTSRDKNTLGGTTAQYRGQAGDGRSDLAGAHPCACGMGARCKRQPTVWLAPA